MAERTLNTRIKLRYASYAEWQSSSVKLLPGEVAVCYLEANNTEIKNTAPTVLFKVGDGEHTFSQLQWASARAADVYDWAKADARPTYTKSDVGLGNVRNVEGYAKTETYSQTEVDDKLSEIRGSLQVDTNTTYRFDLETDNKISIYSKEKGGNEALVGTFEVDFAAINGEIERINNALATKAEASALNNYYTKTEADGKFLVASDIAGKADKTQVAADIKAVDDKFANYYTKEESEKYMTQDEVDARVNKVITDAVDGDTLTSLTQLVQYINTHGGEAAEMAEAIEAIEAQLSGIGAGTGTVKKYVDDAIAALKIGDYAKAADLTALANRVSALEQKPAAGITTGDISNWNSAETNAVNTAKSYTDGKVSEINNAATALGNRVKAIEDDYLKASDKTEVLNAVTGEKTRAEAAEKGLGDRLTAVETNYLSSTDVII